ncbi:hypothetical protein D3C80_1113290 [compost metagenome]
MRFRFYRVDEIRKLDRVLNEEHRHIVANQVKVALIGKELHRKTTNIAHRITRPARSLHGGKTHEHWRDFLRIPQKACLGQLGMGLVGLKITVGAGATGVHDALGNALVVKMRDFLAHDEVFKQRRAARAGPQGILVIRDLDALVGAQRLLRRIAAKHFETL